MKYVVMAAALAALAAPAVAQPFAGPWVGVEAALEDYGPHQGEAFAVVAGFDLAISERWAAGVGGRWTTAGVTETERVRRGQNTSTTRVSLEDQWGVTARVGRRFGERFFVFAEAGYERFHVNAVRELRADFCVPPNGCLISRLDGSFDEEMPTVGLGAEWALTEQASFRAAYAYGDSDAFERNRFSLSAGWRF